MWRLRLHHRIVIPFALMALLTTSAAAVIAVYVVSRTFESRIEQQILNTSEVISRGGLAFNASILRSVKAITGADVITFTRDGAVLASTFDAGQEQAAQTVTSSPLSDDAFEGGGVSVRRLDCGRPCYVVYRRLADRSDALVAVVGGTAEVTAVTNAITRTIVFVAVATLAAWLLVSQLVARRVTAPLDRLVAFTRDIAMGRADERAPTGGDEIGRLGASFNEMLDRLEQSRAALVRSEKLALAGLLAARVAHDIRNPLASMKIQTQLLQSRVRADEQGRTLVAAVMHDIEQVEGVIRDLIELARPGTLKLEPADLNGVVREVLEHQDPRLKHRKIAVHTDFDAALPKIFLDAERFKQALLNLVVNAADAMTNGGILSVSTRLSEDRSFAILDVDDSGVGIDPAILDRVFDPFVSSKPDGVGLGLVNAKAVVENHGGRIELSSRRSGGTRARITLPVSAEA